MTTPPVPEVTGGASRAAPAHAGDAAQPTGFQPSLPARYACGV
ncbi:hypothetical protein BKA21_001537 [Cellulomonas oligotrophica]|uniref:Uncharacterized protein n=1 Tax=Cellulomonas oligotrophica TaxID=931536 RepID=A0A7Y9FER9_9CELL|nr:hypothetical protein [Cellulomonas oligotrophica]